LPVNNTPPTAGYPNSGHQCTNVSDVSEKQPEYLNLLAWGHGLATITTPPLDTNLLPQVLDVWYPNPAVGAPEQSHPPVGFEAPSLVTEAVRVDPVRDVETVVIFRASNLAEAPVDVPDVFLRLHLLSHRLVAPGTVNLEGMDELLPNVVWTELGPVSLEAFAKVQVKNRRESGKQIHVRSISPLPRMVDYVVPTDVRVSNPDSVLLGAHLAPGTTVAHNGHVEHNAGTSGRVRVESHLRSGDVLHFEQTAAGETHGQEAPAA
jgi:2,3,4,5-tetrahydropyridine-2-carboxylate N-succinyltransferase